MSPISTHGLPPGLAAAAASRTGLSCPGPGHGRPYPRNIFPPAFLHQAGAGRKDRARDMAANPFLPLPGRDMAAL